jgi:hypothetical protein
LSIHIKGLCVAAGQLAMDLFEQLGLCKAHLCGWRDSLIGADFLGFCLHGGSPSGLVGPGELPLTGAFLYAAT